jgi:hypothetical protein
MHTNAGLGKSNSIFGAVAAEDDYVLAISDNILEVLLLITKGATGLGIGRRYAELRGNRLRGAVIITTDNLNGNASRD